MRSVNFMKRLILTILSFTFIHSLAKANDFTLGGEYLYWNVLQSGMSYATVVEALDTYHNPQVIPQRQDWGSGCRVTAGYNLPCRFDISFSWTHLHNRIKGNVTRPLIVATEIAGQLNAFAVGGNGIGGIASSKWNMNFDMYDINFGCLTVDSCLYAIHPRIGVKGGTICQKQFIQYNTFLNTETFSFLDASVNKKNNLWCVGPKIGLDSTYKLGCGFSFICDLTAAFLYSRLNTSIKTLILESGLSEVDSILKNIDRNILPTFQALLGLNWDCCSRFPISIGAGYEIQYFWNTWRITNSSLATRYLANSGFGDLMFHGLTAKLFIGF